MKLSIAHFAAAAVALTPSVSAESLRGLLGVGCFANCDDKQDCPSYGMNTCQEIETCDTCSGQCYWDSNAGKCKYSNGNNNRNPVTCRVGEQYWEQDCGESEWCMQDEYGLCGVKESGTCAYFTGNCNNNMKEVCGCNGETYDNECNAYADGNNIRCEGACPCDNDELEEEEGEADAESLLEYS